ncbi:hypothetical protein D3C85_1282840 [compost metagenome]
MVRSRVKTYRYRVGKKNFIVIKVYQSTHAKAHSGNVLASNAVNVKIFKKSKRR